MNRTKIKTSCKDLLINYRALIIAPIIMALVLVAIYIVKGIYPFGTKNISYYDMAQSMIPIYYHTYDVFHGNQGLFWNWYSGGGVSMVDTMGNFVINPINLFFLFVKRENILNSMSIFLLIKVCTTAFTMTFYSKKRFLNIDDIWHIVSGILYASCGFMIQYYTNIHFLDIVILFPLIIYGLDNVLYEKKVLLYTICMTIGFITNIYLMFMVCLFIIFYSVIHLWKNDEVKKTGTIAALGIGTIISLCLSAIVWIPTIIALLGSSRAGNTSNIYKQLFEQTDNSLFGQKIFMLFGSEVGIAALLFVLVFARKRFDEIKKETLMVLLLMIPIFVEPVNLLWHLGGYVQFPMRFGYMLTFCALILMGKSIPIIAQAETKESKLLDNKMLVIALCLFYSIIIYFFTSVFKNFGITYTEFYNGYWIKFLECILLLIVILYSKRKFKYAISIIIIIQCIFGWYGFLAPDYHLQPEWDSSFIVRCNELRNSMAELDEEDDVRISRMRDETMSLNANYPFIVQIGSMSNWTLGSNYNLNLLMKDLGYSTNYTRILDSGSTLFTDAFWNIRKIVTGQDYENEIHRKIKSTENYSVISNELSYPFGLMVQSNMSHWNCSNEDVFWYQNELFHQINPDIENNLFAFYNMDTYLDKEKTDLDNMKYTIYVPVNSLTNLYIKVSASTILTITVNGELKKIPTLGMEDNCIYPAYFNNGIIDVGLYNNQNVSIEINSLAPLNEEDIVIAGLDVELLRESVQLQEEQQKQVKVTQNGLQISLINKDSDYLLLPIGNAKDFHVKRNGIVINYELAIDDSLVMIPLVAGENEIAISYYPKGIGYGLILSIVGLAAICIIGKKKILVNEELVIFKILNICFYIISFGCIIIVYLVPILINVYSQIQNIIRPM